MSIGHSPTDASQQGQFPTQVRPVDPTAAPGRSRAIRSDGRQIIENAFATALTVEPNGGGNSLE